MSGPRIWAHRGSHRAAVENTLAAFRLAIAERADGVELDVRATRDGEVVVFHDRDLARLAGDPRALAACARAELPPIGGAPIPGLDEVLDEVLAAGLEVNVEIKAGAAEVARLLALRPPSDREAIVVSSFDAAALGAVSGVRIARLFERAEELGDGELAGLDGVHPHHGACTPERVAAWHARGLFVNAWTVNDPETARRLVGMSVDGLVTDEVPRVRGACELRS